MKARALLNPIRRSRRGLHLILAGALALSVATRPAHTQGGAGGVAGETVTLLPGGRELLVGGTVGGQVLGTAVVRDRATGTQLAVGALERPRAWHTATLLADGSVLVLGGLGPDGAAIDLAERIDPSAGTSEEMPPLNWIPRVGHSATLLSATQVLLAGGLTAGQIDGTLEVLDLSSWQVRTIGTVTPARSYHAARLLGDGRVELWGGTGPTGLLTDSGVVIDVTSGNGFPIDRPAPDEPAVGIAAADPADGSTDVAVDALVTLRLSRSADVGSVTEATVILEGGGTMPVTVVPAENGRLVFVTPQASLRANTTYQVKVEGARDWQGGSFPVLTTAFTTGMKGSEKKSLPPDTLWNPMASTGSWLMGPTNTPWEHLPPLKAEGGVTALAGQALRFDGLPLADVTMELAGEKTKTDGTGRFLIERRGLATSWQELWIDGRTANTEGATYGTFEVEVKVVANTTTPLSFVIWMPRIDTAHAVSIPSPLPKETVVTTPSIPGLELHLPAGAVIRDHDGRVVDKVSITAIPLDRPPFPLPANVDVPIYFTIQPGGAYVDTGTSGEYSLGARLVYPNYRRRPPGTPMDFWHYDPADGRGWYVYGEGAVTPGGAQVAPDPGVSFREFTGAMVSPIALAAALFGALGNWWYGADPVQLDTGLFVLNQTDLALPDILPISIRRTYRPNDNISRSFGIGASHLYDMFLIGDSSQYTYIELVLPDGERVHYDRISPGTSYLGAVYEHTSSPTGFFGSQIAWNGFGWTLTMKDGAVLTFPESAGNTIPAKAAVLTIRDRYGNAILLTRNGYSDLTRIQSPNGRWINLSYDSSHRIVQASDNSGRAVQYVYDSQGRLSTVTDPLGGVTTYTYDSANRMLTLQDPRGIVYLTNVYDGSGRVIQQTQADGTSFSVAYSVDGSGRITQTDLTDPRGFDRRTTFNAAGYATSDTYAFGQSAQQSWAYTWQPTLNLLTAVTDPLGRQTTAVYDAFGDATSVTRLTGTSNAVTESYSYEPHFQQVSGFTDVLGRQTSYQYDGLGSLTTVTDPLGRITTYNHDGTGTLTGVANALGLQIQFGYAGADLVSLTDSLGRTTTQGFDGVGRRLFTSDAGGHTTQYTYDSGSRVTGRTDALGAPISLSYDSDGNVLTVTDARGSTTTYAYDVMNRVTTRTDPLGRQRTFIYDGNGNLQQATDQAGRATTFTFDPLNRQTAATYPDGAVGFSYDGGDRLLAISDSSGGLITRIYDPLDHLVSESTPQGVITYSVDAAGRRETMTVGGQASVSYMYDDGDRLLSVSQAGSTATMGYDAIDRRTSLTLPNGVSVSSTYDAASELTGLTYALGSTTLGNLAYGYDVSGNRISVAGSWARTSLAPALGAATYDAADELIQWDGQVLTYDANGNLASDGTNSYAWNARGQLASVSGPVPATFVYDGLGRRQTRTIGGGSTDTLNDGLNPVQELVGGTVVTNYLNGLALDDVLERMDASGPMSYLNDAIGGTLALTDALGVLQTTYSYEPFGAVSVSGPATANTRAFAGQGADGTGLYFDRARYYDPRLQRFASQDPLEFAGGDVNLNVYVGNNPQTYTDRLGLSLYPVPPGCLPAASGRKDSSSGRGWVRDFICGGGTIPLILLDGVGPPGAEEPPLPPEWTPDWEHVPDHPRGPRWIDPKGGEWHYDRGNEWKNPHWDYNPRDVPNSPWQNIPIGDLPPHKPVIIR